MCEGVTAQKMGQFFTTASAHACKMVKGRALYPFGTGASATYKRIASAGACAAKCVAVKAKYGCEYTAASKTCVVVKGPITGQKKPSGSWPSYGCQMVPAIAAAPRCTMTYGILVICHN